MSCPRTDKKYLEFGKAFEERFIGQDPHENRTIIDTLNIGWELLRMLPREELDRIDTKILDEYLCPGGRESCRRRRLSHIPAGKRLPELFEQEEIS